jgi:hypothetical protein
VAGVSLAAEVVSITFRIAPDLLTSAQDSVHYSGAVTFGGHRKMRPTIEKDRRSAAEESRFSPALREQTSPEFGARWIELAKRIEWRMVIAMIECKRPSLGV